MGVCGSWTIRWYRIRAIAASLVSNRSLTLGVYEGSAGENGPPVIMSWRSVRVHDPGGAAGGPFDPGVDLDPTAADDGAEGPTVEPRDGGSRSIEMDFDQPVLLAGPVSVVGVTHDGTIDGGDMTANPDSSREPDVGFHVTAETLRRGEDERPSPASGDMTSSCCTSRE